MAVRQAHKMKDWLIFFLYGVKETAENSIQRFKDILVLKARLEQKVLPHFSTRRQNNAQSLMRYLYQNPFVTINGVAALLNIKINTAAALVNDFVKYEVLREQTGRLRNRVFWFIDYLVIFNPSRQ